MDRERELYERVSKVLWCMVEPEHAEELLEDCHRVTPVSAEENQRIHEKR